MFSAMIILLRTVDVYKRQLYRDDLSTLAYNPIVHGTEIDLDLNGKTIILVDVYKRQTDTEGIQQQNNSTSHFFTCFLKQKGAANTNAKQLP